MTTARCCINHRDYIHIHIHIRSIYHIPCTHKRYPMPHSHEWVNILFIGDSFENTDHIRKKLDITKGLASLSWIHCCYTAMSSAESRDVCFNILFRCSWYNLYIYISNNGHHSLTLMAKRFEYHHTILLNEVEGGGGVYWSHLVRLSPCPSVRQSISRQHRVRYVSSTLLTRSISYLHILSSNFRCVTCNFFKNSKILNFWRIL